jgi:hypothetical protein
VLKQLSAAVPKQLLLLGRLLVSSAAEEQEERQLRVPPAVAVLTAAAPAAVVDDVASCSSKMGTFDIKKIFHRSMEISPRCRLSSRRITRTLSLQKSKKMCTKAVPVGRYLLHFELITVLSKRRGSNQCAISVYGIRCFF